MIRQAMISALERALFDKGSGGKPPRPSDSGGGKYNPDGWGCPPNKNDKGGRAFVAVFRYYAAGGRPRPIAEARNYA
jgi:hypothetical protein